VLRGRRRGRRSCCLGEARQLSCTRRGAAPEVTVAWLVGVARHKLVDHWRRLEREERSRVVMDGLCDDIDDPWDEHLDRSVVYAALAQLNPGR
jgi:RNA polymerase sigma-70 factor, ECF subfamily